MHLQVLSSGSGGNSALVRADELRLLVDAGLGPRAMAERLAAARVEARTLQHIAVTHGHLDHARSAGVLAKRAGAAVLAGERVLAAPALARAPRMERLVENEPFPLGGGKLRLTPVRIPHDAHPTHAFRLDHDTEHGTRTAVVLTDMGRPEPDVARRLSGAHVLVLEFNHDRGLLASGPYPASLKARVGGDQGHLSNAQAAQMLRLLAGPALHTLVLAHLSAHNNRPELALEAARSALDALGMAHVALIVASQHEIGPNLAV